MIEPKLKDILLEIDFVERFKNMGRLHKDFRTSLKTIDVELVDDLIDSHGYFSKYHKKENFFVLKKDGPNDVNSLHLSVHNGFAEVIVNLIIDEKKVGGSFSPLTLRCGDLGERIKSPMFSTPEQLNIILEETISIFEDILTKLCRLD